RPLCPTLFPSATLFRSLEQRGGLAHVGITDDHVQSTETFGVGVGFVAGVDDGPRASGGRGDTFPDVFGTLADTEQSTTRGLEHLDRKSTRLNSSHVSIS